MLMEADVEGLIGAGRYEERSSERLNRRDGHRDRTLDTRLGPMRLRLPKRRQGAHLPPFLEPRKTSGKALVAAIQEARIGGVPARRVDDLAQAMGLTGISESTASKLCKDIDERVSAFLERPLSGGWPYLRPDATHLRRREGGRVISVAAVVAVACDAEGRRRIVGLHIGPSEAETFWSAFLKSLAKRGPKGVKPVVPDAHEGLRAAVARAFGAARQRCRVAAPLPRPPDEERPGLCADGPADDGRGRAAPGLPAARSGRHPADLAARRRPVAAALAQARHADGRERGGRARLHGVSCRPPDEAALGEHAGAAEQRGEAPRRRRRHLPLRAVHRAAG
jgi:hypothetical protein